MATESKRSKTGCLTCKNRRKKCDETRPMCERCIKAGMNCLGYSYLEDQGHRVARAKSKAAQRVAAATANTNNLSRDDASQSIGPPAEPTGPLNVAEVLAPNIAQSYEPTAEDSQRLSGDSPAGGLLPEDPVFDFSFWSPMGSYSSSSPETIWDNNPMLGASSSPISSNDSAPSPKLSSPLMGNPPSTSRQQLYLTPHPILDSNALSLLNSAQTLLLGDILNQAQSSVQPADTVPLPLCLAGGTTLDLQVSNLSQSESPKCEDAGGSENSDPEGAKVILIGCPTLDPTAQSNSLPFALQSYANWMANVVFEPARLASALKSRVTMNFKRSKDSRVTLTMFAGLLHAVWTKGAPTPDYINIASLLGQRVKSRAIQARSKLRLTANDKDDIMVIRECLEMIPLLCLTSPSRSAYDLLKETAPVFRRACPEPPGEPIDLPSKFIDSDVSLRHFIVLDVLLSITFGRPMLYRYKANYDFAGGYAAFSTRIKGLQWLNGMPDHIAFLAARMNMLRAHHESKVDPEIILELAQELRDFKPQICTSDDAYLPVARLAVQETWRLAALVFLYMGLDGASANDPRVVNVYKNFIRLFRRTTAGRMPDAFLVSPVLMLGVASQDEQERGLILQRLLGLRECATPGTFGNDVVLVLNNIWARSSIEGRAAEWDDLRIGYLGVLGDF